MQVFRLYRVLAVQRGDEEIQRGPGARGTLALMTDRTGCIMRFVPDNGTPVQEPFEKFDVLPSVPVNDSVVVTLADGQTWTFTAYRELQAAEKTQFTVVQAHKGGGVTVK